MQDGLIVSKRMDIVVGLDAQQGKGMSLQQLAAWQCSCSKDTSGLITSASECSSYASCECIVGVHLAAWGRIDTGRGNAIDMTLGIPGPSLLPLGLTDLPEDYVFMIPMHGSSTHPEIDIIRWASSCHLTA